MDYKKRTCSRPRKYPNYTNVQVMGTGTKYDGMIFKGNDIAKHDILDGREHFDLLLPPDEYKAFLKKGVYKAKAIIAPPGPVKYKNGGG